MLKARAEETSWELSLQGNIETPSWKTDGPSGWCGRDGTKYSNPKDKVKEIKTSVQLSLMSHPNVIHWVKVSCIIKWSSVRASQAIFFHSMSTKFHVKTICWLELLQRCNRQFKGTSTFSTPEVTGMSWIKGNAERQWLMHMKAVAYLTQE